MTGYGSRFAAAGYNRLKPFIEVFGRPMIEWVVRMFPGDKDNISFIVREEHLATLSYIRPELARIAPHARVLAVDDWEKKGPVFEVLRQAKYIDPSLPSLICYCDFYMQWDWAKFKSDVLDNGCDGAIPCYTGFHPHLAPKKNLYASCQCDDDGYLIEIREKYSWTEDKAKTFHSPGVYYFRDGATMLEYCRALVESKEEINGEYYASLPYNHMVRDGKKVWVPQCVRHFCQWGTPEDLEDFLFWTDRLKGSK
jgi:NDP-sugar pyrophosphorylase family protein